IPTFEKLLEFRNRIDNVFKDIVKLDVKPLFMRIKEHDPIQKAVDELALEMLGLEKWKSRLAFSLSSSGSLLFSWLIIRLLFLGLPRLACSHKNVCFSASELFKYFSLLEFTQLFI
ncbi:MAG: hypothetical protein RMK50_07305, partial [Nitrososphaerota archaeon]|nr:hypothetical protein [Candidatus Bathyarchaeota archaeon]MDW8194605.1 hypothetical protein [Nitrososphaerota archaeon]